LEGWCSTIELEASQNAPSPQVSISLEQGFLEIRRKIALDTPLDTPLVASLPSYRVESN